MKLFKRREFLAVLISSEHAFEGIGSSKNDFSESGTVLLCDLRCEDIFELVSKLAQLVKAASSGITLERMHGAAYTTNDLFIGGVRLELEPCFVERLQQLIRAFEKDSAKLWIAILRRPAQEFASTR